MSSSVADKKKKKKSIISGNIDDRESALASRWIRRLCPPPPPPPHVTPLFAPLHPPPHKFHQQKQNISVRSSSEFGFGPLQVRPGWAHRLPTAGEPQEDEKRTLSAVGNFKPLDRPLTPTATNSLASSHNSSIREEYVAGVQNRDEDRLAAARGNFYNPFSFGFRNTRYLTKERQSYNLPNEAAEESFSYWDMGRLERSNFVSSVYPATSSTKITTLDAKRAANTYGFFPSKLRRLNSQ